MVANITPAASATTLPRTWASDSWSTKNSATPHSARPIVTQSMRVARSWRITADKSAAHAGAEYWIKIALAAVVHLLAKTNNPVVAASASADSHSVRVRPRHDGR